MKTGKPVKEARVKITHNKVGQNLNIAEGGKKEKAEKSQAVVDNKPSTPASALNNVGAGASRVDVSSRAQEAKRIKELAMAAPDVDEAKVAKFRQLIDDKKYQVDARAVADKMVDDHLETGE